MTIVVITAAVLLVVSALRTRMSEVRTLLLIAAEVVAMLRLPNSLVLAGALVSPPTRSDWISTTPLRARDPPPVAPHRPTRSLSPCTADTGHVLIAHSAATKIQQPSGHRLGQRYRPIRFAHADERRVIITRAVSNSGVTPRFINRLAALVDFTSVDELPGWDDAASETKLAKGKKTPFFTRRRSLLDEAAAIVLDELGIRMRPNQRSNANGRIGRFVADVDVGVVVSENAVAVHLHSLDGQRHAVFNSLLSELVSEVLAQPARDLTFNVRPGERNASKLYLETTWPFSADDEQDDGHAERLAAVAAWLRGVRDRFD